VTKLRLILTLNIVAIFVAKKKAQGATTGFFFRSSLEKSISGKCIALFCNYYRGEFQVAPLKHIIMVQSHPVFVLSP
jgi:hypothetical protein